MSCPNCYQLQGNCGCSESPSVECSCSDPGLETSGAHLAVLDSQFCQRRLQNAPGLLWQSSAGKTVFSTEPRVPFTTLTVAEGDKFGAIVTSTGSTGIIRRVSPDNGVDGAVFADGSGNFVIKDPATSFTVPDPLTISTLNTTTANISALNVTGLPTFSSLGTDTISSTIGLNASNQLVKGTTPTISVASYFENDSLVGPGTPNWELTTTTDNCFIGNELSDPDAIASVQDSKTIRIDKAGDYLISWRGVFTGFDPAAGSFGNNLFEPGIWLTVNSAVVDYGAKSIMQSRSMGGWVGGEYMAVGLTVGTLIRLQGNGGLRISPSKRKTGLSGVGVILKKIK